MIWFVLASAIYNIVISLLMNTENALSAFVLKVIPFFLGLGTLFYAVKILNVL